MTLLIVELAMSDTAHLDACSVSQCHPCCLSLWILIGYLNTTSSGCSAQAALYRCQAQALTEGPSEDWNDNALIQGHRTCNTLNDLIL